MADTITPTQPLAPTLPVTVPPEDKRREKQKKTPNENESEQEQTDSKNNTEKPRKGLFDEYV
ncbi:MAG: hypothetical protein MUQ51_04950 [Pseudomonadota bacterium]|nr:hypothetical protein [Pseudomonadota bacterium]MDO7667840.1 hypothetical protein [Pseudomonadota bacterium]MDO7710952.1 hypothetical protein [Pseudomonadota bacterium]